MLLITFISVEWNWWSIPKLPSKFGWGEVVLSHALLGMCLLTYADIKDIKR